MAFLLAAPSAAAPPPPAATAVPAESKLKGVRAIWGFDKNEFGKVILVGPRSCECHVLLHSVYFNWILASGDNGRAIEIV
jgi:hypothetical protein